MRSSRSCCLVLGIGFLAMLAPLTARGQSDLPRFAGGVFGSVGSEGAFPIDMTASGGAYVEAARFRFRPGVEVRGTVGDIEGRLVLAGPRVSHSLVGGDVYAAGLFGPGHILNATGTKEISVVTSQLVVGVGRNIGSYVRWRVLELSAGFFSGSAGAQTFALSTGIVLHFH